MDTRAKGCNGLFRSVCCVACTVYMCVAYSPLFPTKEKPGQIPVWTPGQRDVKACSGLCAVWHVLRTCVACIVYMCGILSVYFPQRRSLTRDLYGDQSNGSPHQVGRI